MTDRYGNNENLSSETYGAIDAYREEFQYYADEAPEFFLKLSKELFTENHGEQEASKINWLFIKSKFVLVNGG